MRKKLEKHGDYRKPLWTSYNDMKQRCKNKNFKQWKDYGGRGITVCPEWEKSYLAFREWAMKNGYVEGLTIDRIDNDSGYSPDNCRWVDHSIQKTNMRKRKDNQSGYIGVSCRKDTSKYTSYIWLYGKRTLLGCYDTALEAVEARDRHIIENKLPHNLQILKD